MKKTMKNYKLPFGGFEPLKELDKLAKLSHELKQDRGDDSARYEGGEL